MAQSPSLDPSPLEDTNRPNPVFQAAFEAYKKRLLPEELEDFRPSSPQEIIAQANKLNADHRKKSRARRCIEMVSELVQPLEAFFSAVDNGVSSHPEVAGIVWGAIRFVVQGINSVAAHFKIIEETLEKLPAYIRFYHDYATFLFDDSEPILKALAGVYGEILELCTIIRRMYYKKGGRLRAASQVIFRAMNPYGREFEGVLKHLEDRRNELDREISHETLRQRHNEYKEAKEERRRAEVARRMDEEEYKKAEEERKFTMIRNWRATLLDNLAKRHAESHTKHQTCLDAVSKGLDAGRWLLDRDEFKNWSTNLTSGMLWLQGKPGAGKTILASIVIEALKRLPPSGDSDMPPRRTVAYFYCQHDHSWKRDPLAVLPSLLHDVLEQLPLPPTRLLEMNPHTIHSREEVCQMLREMTVDSGTVFLVVDALDECTSDHRGALINALRTLSRDIKILVTTRDWTEFRDAFKGIPVISLDTRPDSDIVKFIRKKVRLLEDEEDEDPEEFVSPSLKVRDPELRDRIVRTLVKGADGMFLWVRLQILHLRARSTEHDIAASLEDLPEGLDATYNRALRQIHALPHRRRTHVQRLLRWVICQRHPLGLEDLASAVVADDMPEYIWDPKRCIAQPRRLIDDCAHLVQAMHGSVRLIHASVRDFLLGSPSAAEPGLAAYHFHPGRDDTHLQLASSCVNRLLQDHAADFPLSKLHSYAVYNWGEHIISCPLNVNSPLLPAYPLDTYLRRMFSASDFVCVWSGVLNHALSMSFRYNRAKLVQSFAAPDRPRVLWCFLTIAPGWISLPDAVFPGVRSNAESAGSPIAAELVDCMLPDPTVRVVPQRINRPDLVNGSGWVSPPVFFQSFDGTVGVPVGEVLHTTEDKDLMNDLPSSIWKVRLQITWPGYREWNSKDKVYFARKGHGVDREIQLIILRGIAIELEKFM
ncbi:hypothetical protein BV25DRAFT_1895091 [Artomyces pyxidatus]|uniref:Uncharacterized protein n=1 Tax=Artomyces pyxidatus TaxID=48021 RepID=A0ACB8SGP3_9AGAM|nr:hypothetical protein BV25DRAFT_1895091 [Artomyces pyxidatus]